MTACGRLVEKSDSPVDPIWENRHNTKTQPPQGDSPTMTDHPNLAETLTPLAQELASVLADKADLEARERDIKARIRSLVPGPDTYAAGDAELVVSTNRRFDPKRALPLIPEALLPIVTYPETVIDKDKLRVLLPEVFEAAQVAGDYRIGFAR